MSWRVLRRYENTKRRERRGLSDATIGGQTAERSCAATTATTIVINNSSSMRSNKRSGTVVM